MVLYARRAIQAKLEAKGEGNKGVRERLEPRELRSKLFELFSQKDVWMVKEINKDLQQPEVGVFRVRLMVEPINRVCWLVLV